MSKFVKFADDALDNSFYNNKINRHSTNSHAFSTTGGFSIFDNNPSLFHRSVDGLDARIRNYTPGNVSKWKKYDAVKNIRDGRVPSGGGDFNALARYTTPYYKYNKLIKRADAAAVNFGFRNESDFAVKLKEAADLCETAAGKRRINNDPRWRNVFLSLKKTKRKDKKLMAAVATGTAAGLVIYLAKEQEKNTGCFRYKLGEEKGNKKDDGLIRYKIAGNFCIGGATSGGEGSNNDYDNDDKDVGDVKILAFNTHPLSDSERWGCDYDNFYATGDEIDRQRIDEIRQLGCNGLCDVLNFNVLASFTNDEYAPFIERATVGDDDKSQLGGENMNNDKFMYVCERATFLRTLIDQTLDVVDDVFDEAMSSSLVKKMSETLRQWAIFIVVITLIFFLVSRQTFVPNLFSPASPANNFSQSSIS